MTKVMSAARLRCLLQCNYILPIPVTVIPCRYFNLRCNREQQITDLCRNRSHFSVIGHQLCKTISTRHHLTFTRPLSFWGSSKSSDWTQAVSNAEKIVGYPTSFMSLRCLLSDELSNVALQMRKLVGTKHPLLKTARKFLFDGKHSLQTRGLLVLLVSKAAGPGPPNPTGHIEQMVSGIYPVQRSLAEIAEMIHTASLIHSGVVNLKDLLQQDTLIADMELGNKMAVLSGDFLLANASTGLAALGNTKVVELIASAIGDLMEAEFIINRDSVGQPYLGRDGLSVDDWLHLIYKSRACLIAKSCQAALMLAGHSQHLQQQAFEFGKNMAIAHQIHEDLLPYTRPLEENNNNVTILNAPVVVHINTYPQDSAVQQLLTSKSVQSTSLLKLLEKGKAIDETKELCRNYAKKAMDALQGFPHSEARLALQTIVEAVKYV